MIDWTQIGISLGYLGVFLLGLLGAASFFIPLPTTIGLLGVAALRIFDPTLLALAFGIGAGIGQLTSYVVGYVGRAIVDEKSERRLAAMMKIFDRFGVMLVIFIFALTPLPDSVLFIPLGLVRYPVRRVFVASLLGKITMSLIITYFGELLGQTLTDNWIFTIITMALLVVVVIAMFKIDWEKLIDKYPQTFGGKKPDV